MAHKENKVQLHTEAWEFHMLDKQFMLTSLQKQNWEIRFQELKQERIQFLDAMTDEQRQQFLEKERNQSRERQRQWREANPGQVKAMWKKYKEANKDKIKEKNQVRVTCECGAEVAKWSLNGHLKSKAHLKWKENHE